MAYDEALAARVRRALAGRNDVIEKRMFGGLTFMLAGHMCCGVNRDDLIIRIDAKTTVEDLNSPHVRPWDFMRGRCGESLPWPQRGVRTTAAATARSSWG